MRLRDEAEAVLRSWDAHERARGANPIIDYDFHPTHDPVEPAASRLDVFDTVSRLHARAVAAAELSIAARLTADLAYLRALLGERQPLPDYLRDTQGCGADGWPHDYVTAVGDHAREHLAGLGIEWDSSASQRWEDLEGRLSVTEAATAIRRAATELEPAVRDLVGTTARFDLTVETVDIDAYWGYWVDGSGSNARLRLNLRRARFTEVTARQFALHEVLGHALQGASLAARTAAEDVPWVRLLSVHAPQQVLFEGLAQALPLFVTPEDKQLIARVRMAHYLQLVRAELHLAIHEGATIPQCAAQAHARVPFWTSDTIANALSDTGANPLLRSYLWSYPAGIDWFVALADRAPDRGREILRRAYRDPLTPTDLENLWPAGPRIGGTPLTCSGTY